MHHRFLPSPFRPLIQLVLFLLLFYVLPAQNIPVKIKPDKDLISGVILDPGKHLTVDWKFNLPESHSFNPWELDIKTSGDFNSDGYDDLVLITTNSSKKEALRHVFYGSATGLSTTPGSVINAEFSHNNKYNLLTVPVGDINGDGYEDVCHNGNLNYAQFYLGSANGLKEFPEIIVNLSSVLPPYPVEFIPYSAGDVNGDGYDDVILLFVDMANSGAIIYGGENNLSQPSEWPERKDNEDYLDRPHSIYTNDFNNDGFGDVAYFYFPYNLHIYYGTQEGLPLIPSQNFVENYVEVTSVVTGNFNGDNYPDLLVTTMADLYPDGYRYKLLEISGSSTGLDLDNIEVLDDYNGEGWWQGKSLMQLGDINNDGIDDFSYDWKIYLGGSRYSLQVDNILFGLGDFNGDGSNDITSFFIPFSEIFYSPSYEPFSLTCEDSAVVCFTGNNDFYKIPPAELSKSHFRYFNYRVTYPSSPNPVRYGDTEDASGNFQDNSRIVWSATGYNNISINCTTKVKFKYVPVTTVTIKDGYTVSPGGAANTIYIGQGPDRIRLAALPSGGGGPYQYKWSNGSTEKNPVFQHRIPGEYPHSVELTNVHGCTSSDSIVVKVENALCASTLVSIVMNQFPMIFQNAILANLIIEKSKIAVCKDGQTLCIDKKFVTERLSRPGYTLGACIPGNIPAEAYMTDEIEEILSGKLKVLVAPNPSTNKFQLNVVSIYNKPVSIRITDVNGRLVESINRAETNTTINAGEQLGAGVYFAEIISGSERKIMKLVKIN